MSTVDRITSVIAKALSVISLMISTTVLAQSSGVVTVTDADGDPYELYSGSYALLVGVSDYTNGWEDLDQIPFELESVKTALESHGFEVTYDPAKTTEVDIRASFNRFIRAHGHQQNNRLVFVYAGHGYTWEEGNQGYLVPSDAPLPTPAENGHPGASFLSSSLQISQIVEWSRQMTAKHALFLFDSCFSGTIFKTLGPDDALQPQIFNLDAVNRPVRQFITAGSANERVPAKSTFMPAFVDAISVGDGDIIKDSIITGNELGFYLASVVPRHTSQTPQFGKHPEYALSRGNFVFVLEDYGSGSGGRETVASLPSPAISPPENNAEALGYYEDCEGGDATGCFNLGWMYEKGEGVDEDDARTVSLYQKACEGGHARGCSNLGVMYEKGEGVDEDDATAVNLFRKACDGREAGGCANLGVMYEKGEGVDEDDARAVSLFQKACEGGDATGCLFLGMMYQKGEGVDEDNARAVSLFQKACDRGHATGCFSLGAMYDKGEGVDEDDARTVSLYQKSCDGGDALGCLYLGWMYSKGEDVDEDDARAVSLFQKACDRGHATGCLSLGAMYQKGEGVDKDYARAASLFQKACDGGNALGCHNLGVSYQYGEGVDEDDARAVSLFQKACEGGEAGGCNNLGVMYTNGEGVDEDVAKAVSLYQKACEGGYARGCSNLGWMYKNGEGVDQDDARAVSLYQKACDMGHKDSC